ncbi:MAG: hypothetical protein ABI411_09755 [Tahibacter sp.]
MKQRWSFFKEKDSSFGLFYPHNYIVAGFDTPTRAQLVEQDFLDAGFAADEVTSATGDFVVNQLESQDDASLLDRMKAEIARIAGTEAGYIDDDLKLARRGGGFLFVHVPTDADADRALALLKRAHPIYARRYLTLAIERLIYPNQSTL